MPLFNKEFKVNKQANLIILILQESMELDKDDLALLSDEENEDNIFDSPQWPQQFQNLNIQHDLFDGELSLNIALSKKQQQQTKSNVPKIQKSKKIRTSRNVQKTYHNILKHWLQKNKCSTILPKYNEYFNQRLYFILVLDQITKQIDGEQFAVSYETLALEIVSRKQKEILQLETQKQNSEQSKHLRRVIQEILFSIKACKQFVAGNVLDSIVTVYKRNQQKIAKIKQFEKAIRTFREVTGHDPQNF